jgi:hypothetical protein
MNDQHLAVAELALRAYWLRHVLRVAEECWRTRQGLHLYPPNAVEIEGVASVLAAHESTSSLALTGEETP